MYIILVYAEFLFMRENLEMKKIMNNPKSYVSDMLCGMANANNKLQYIPGLEVMLRCNRTRKVALVSGGGSGHEPAHAGFVGKGMLDAAVAGNVFASPSPDRVIEAIRRVDTGLGVLLIIKNYSGDVMNFQIAAELAAEEGIKTDYVIVKDDVAVPDSTFSTGRRGIAGTVFVHKIAGAKAEMGASLEEVKVVAEKCIHNLRSIGMAMTACSLPGVSVPGFNLNDDELEIGIGIHGEPGIQRQQIVSSAELAESMLAKILADYDFSKSEVAVMVNGMGGTPLSELYIFYNDLFKLLENKNIRIYRSFVGNYITSLEMMGCSISLLKLDDELKMLLDYPSEANAFRV